MLDDPIQRIFDLLINKINTQPDIKLEEHVSQLKIELKNNQELKSALQYDARLIQTNREDSTAFQTLVEGGVVNNIGVNYNISERDIVNSLAHFLQNLNKERDPIKQNQKELDNLDCPFRGLFPFREEDSNFFFGRDSIVSELCSTINQQSLITIIGSSGSGKSSVVFAGLIPQLRLQDNWIIQSFRIGNDDLTERNPFRSLASVLVPMLELQMSESELLTEIPKLTMLLQENRLTEVIRKIIKKKLISCEFLLVIDQFEELFINKNLDLHYQFIDSLIKTIQELPESFKLILTLRSDYLDNALHYPPLADVLSKYKPSLLRSMTLEEIRSTIEKPIQKQNLQLKIGLTDRILKDIGKVANLPLLEFALTELWMNQSQGKLTHETYHKIGGVTKALASKAEENYNQFKSDEKLQIQRIFIQLVRLGEEGEFTKRLATRDEIGQENWSLVTRLASQRLVVTGLNDIYKIETVELVHEALIYEWGRLNQWVNENRDFRTWQRCLRSAEKQWKNTKRDNGALLRGKLLVEAEQWLLERAIEIPKNERIFIELSVKFRDRTHKIIFQVLVGFSSFAILLTGIASLGWIDADRQKRAVFAEKSASLALQQLDNSPIDALIFAMEGGQELKKLVSRNSSLGDYPTINPVLALQSILSEIRLQDEVNTFQKVNSITFDKDKELMATAGDDGKIKLWKRNGSYVGEIIVDSKIKINSVRFSPDNKNIATAGANGIVKIWDLEKRKLNHKILAHPGSGVRNIRFGNNKDSNILVTSGYDGKIKIWDNQGKFKREFIDIKHELSSAHKDGIEVVRLSEDDKQVLTGGKDNVAKLWDIKGNLESEFIGHTKTVKSARFYPDGNTIVTAGEDDTIRFWDKSGNQKRPPSVGNQKGINAIEFDSDKIITAGNDGTIKVWNSEGDFLTKFKAHDGRIETIRVNEDKTLITAGQEDGKVKLWKLPVNREILLTGHRATVNSVRFSPDSKTVATASSDGTIRLWNLDGKELKTIRQPANGIGGFESIRFIDRGKGLLSGGDQNSKVRIWNLDGSLLKEFKTGQKGIHSVNVNPISDTILSTTGYDKSVKLWKFDGSFIKKISYKENVVSSRFSPNGKLLVTTGNNGMLRLSSIDDDKDWDLEGHQGNVNSSGFSPNGELLATVGDDQYVRLWSIDKSQPIRIKIKSLFKTFDGSLQSVNFSPDGKRIATSTKDGKVQFWTTFGQRLANFKVHSRKVRSADFSGDGLWFATASEDGTAIIWKVRNLEDLLTEGCSWLKYHMKTHANDRDRLPICSTQNKFFIDH